MLGPRSIPRALASMRGPQDRALRRREMAEATWFAWTLRDFLRYWYLLGVLATVLLVPLQMVDSWLPFNAPQVLDPIVVGAFILTFVLVVVYLGIQGYVFIWKVDGTMDRLIARHEARANEDRAGPDDGAGR